MPQPVDHTRADPVVQSGPTSTLKWGTIIPLIGGSSIGCSQSTGTLPSFHLSYTPFKANEKHLERYWPAVPKFTLDKNQQPTAEVLAGVDYINSVCPCAGLSLLNVSKEGGAARGSDAEKNKWMFESAEFGLDKVKPKVMWGENAPGLFTPMGQGVLDGLRRLGARYGYSFSVVKTNSQLHGLPQRRMRTFYFFWNSPTVPQLTWKKRACKSFADAHPAGTLEFK